jgi:hypothetical protein
MDAKSILERVRAAYATAEAYSDSGEVMLAARGTTPELRARFQTTFERATGLRWQFQLLSQSGSVVDAQFSLRTDLSELVTVQGIHYGGGSVRDALVRLTGVTFGVADAILPMLLQVEVPGLVCDASTGSIRLHQPQLVDAEQCFVLEKVERVSPNQTLFVRMRDFMLRRITYTGNITAATSKMARARGIFIDKLSPWEQTTTYDAHFRV